MEKNLVNLYSNFLIYKWENLRIFKLNIFLWKIFLDDFWIDDYWNIFCYYSWVEKVGVFWCKGIYDVMIYF